MSAATEAELGDARPEWVGPDRHQCPRCRDWLRTTMAGVIWRHKRTERGRFHMVPCEGSGQPALVLRMDRRTARDLARGHVARALRSCLDAGWPQPGEHGYTDADRELVTAEIERIVQRFEEVNNRSSL